MSENLIDTAEQKSTAAQPAATVVVKAATPAKPKAPTPPKKPAAPAVEIKAKSSDGLVGVIFKGPAKAYSMRGKRFEKDQVVKVDAETAKHVLKTTFFAQATDAQVKAAVEKKELRQKTNYRVGDFKSKEDAAQYARRVHGVTLDLNQGLKEINRQCVQMAKAALHFAGKEATEDADGVITLAV